MQLLYGKFSCNNCGRFWSSRSRRRDVYDSQDCKECGYEVLPYRIYHVRDKMRHKRMYGRFKCYTCQSQWGSAYSWTGTGQLCKHCNTFIMPYQLKPLKYTNVYEKATQERDKKHIQQNCEMCQLLGMKCTKYYFMMTRTRKKKKRKKRRRRGS